MAVSLAHELGFEDMLRGALVVQERILSMLELNNQFYPGQTIHLAMGAACGYEGQSMETVVHRADQAMYAEKTRFYQAHRIERRLSTV
ncbi:MAG: hypothetical protein KBT18_00155 [Comamonas sp.]|nr:hypothetical protein [Candidatus Comamonas equi]